MQSFRTFFRSPARYPLFAALAVVLLLLACNREEEPRLPPGITEIRPDSAYVGDTITITGTDLGHYTVSFNGTVATDVISATAGGLRVTVPAGATTGPLTITGPEGTSEGTLFQVRQVIPISVAELQPDSADVGSTVTVLVNGTFFKPGDFLGEAPKAHFYFSSANPNAPVRAAVNGASPGVLTVTIPVGAVTGSVSMTLADGTRITGPSLAVVVIPVAINALTPERGNVGSTVTVDVQGTNLNPADFLGASPKANFYFSSVNPNAPLRAAVSGATREELTVTVPAGAVTGPVSMTLADGSRMTGPPFTVEAASVVITSLVPNQGRTGTSVTVSLGGTGYRPADFLGADPEAGFYFTSFNPNQPIRAQATAATATQLTVTVPADAKTGPVSVGLPDGTRVGGPLFTVLAALEISKIEPVRGNPGSQVTVTVQGQGFVPDDYLSEEFKASFFFTSSNPADPERAEVRSATANQLVVVVPPDARTGPVSMTLADGSRISGPAFTVTYPVQITGLNPTGGNPGSPVTVTVSGTEYRPADFLGESPRASFFFANRLGNGEVQAEVRSTTASQLVVVVPDEARTGPVSMTLAGGSRVVGPAFTVTYPAHTVSSVTPNSGRPGSTVTVRGTHFSPFQGENQVLIGGKPLVLSAQSETELRGLIAADATVGTAPVRVRVRGREVNGLNFTVLSPVVASKAVYFAEALTATLYRADIDAEGDVSRITLFKGEDDEFQNISGMVVDAANNRMYWTDGVLNQIMAGNLNGSGRPQVLFDGEDGVNFPYGIALANGRLYWANSGANQVVRANANGSGNVEVLFDDAADGVNFSHDVKLEIAGNQVYWTENGSLKIRRGNLDGSGSAEDLFTEADGLGNPLGLALDAAGGKLYVADSPGQFGTGTDRIRVGNLNGSGDLTTLFSAGDNVDGPDAIALDLTNRQIYWYNTTTNGGADDAQAIMRGRMDGAGKPQAVVEGIAPGVALVVP